MRIGPKQKKIIEIIRKSGGALNTTAIAGHFGRQFTNAPLWRLAERGILRYVAINGDTESWMSGPMAARYEPTETERRALANARAAHPRASAFWVLADEWMK